MREGRAYNIAPGTCIAGRYEVVRRLGAGSIGVVYECNHRELAGYTLAMKVLFEEHSQDPARVAEFRKEVVASYAVNSANVVRVFEYFNDGPLVAFTMEYVSGSNLADFISVSESISILDSLAIIKQICSGLAEIHRAGIVHQSLKPENILLTEEGEVKISDFGIASARSGLKPIEEGGVITAVDYVSPEYLEGEGHDERSDIYAVGIIAYEMVAGRLPFVGKSPLDSLTRRLRSPAPELRSENLGCPPALAAIIHRCLARDPDERYQEVSELGEAIASVLKEQRLAIGLAADLPLDVDQMLESMDISENEEQSGGERSSLREDEDISDLRIPQTAKFNSEQTSDSYDIQHSSYYNYPSGLDESYGFVASHGGFGRGGYDPDEPEIEDQICASDEKLIAIRERRYAGEVEARKDIFRTLVVASVAIVIVLVAILLLVVFWDLIEEGFLTMVGVIFEEVRRALSPN